MSTDKEVLLVKAKCADYANDFEQMYEFMKKIAEYGDELDEKESDYFGSAVRNLRHDKKDALRRLKKLLDKETDDAKKKIITEYRDALMKKLKEFYNDVISVLEKSVIPGCEQDESSVFFMKLKGDIYRYLIEVEPTPEYESKGRECYEKATERASKLEDINAVKLGLVCNYSFFLFDFLGKKEDAVKMTKEAIDKAAEKKEELEDRKYKDSKNTLAFLKENYRIWVDEKGGEKK